MARISRPIEFWLARIVESADRLASHIEGKNEGSFVADTLALDASCWCISCIGEASGKILELDPQFGTRVQNREFAAAYAARNRYVHGYFMLDEEQIWQTASEAVPKLRALAKKLLHGLS
jgi:uncharacterized protein with HEPN domain